MATAVFARSVDGCAESTRVIVVSAVTTGPGAAARGADGKDGCAETCGCVEPIQVGGTISLPASGEVAIGPEPVAGLGASSGKSAPNGVAGAPAPGTETVSPPGKSAASRGSEGDVETESCMGKLPSVESNAPIHGAQEM